MEKTKELRSSRNPRMKLSTGSVENFLHNSLSRQKCTLGHDNAPAHTSDVSKVTIKELGPTLHSRSCPGNFYLFCLLKKISAGK